MGHPVECSIVEDTPEIRLPKAESGVDISSTSTGDSWFSEPPNSEYSWFNEYFTARQNWNY